MVDVDLSTVRRRPLSSLASSSVVVSGVTSNIQSTRGLWDVSQMQSSEGTLMVVRSQPEAWWIQQRSCTPLTETSMMTRVSSRLRVEHGPRTGVPDSDAVVVVPHGKPKEAIDEEGMGSTQRSCMECGSEMTTLVPAPCASRPAGLRLMQPPLPRPGGPESIIIVALPTTALSCDRTGAVEDAITHGAAAEPQRMPLQPRLWTDQLCSGIGE
jgi:hypothetical protein